MEVKLLLEKAGVAGIRGFEVYRREGGYRSVEKAIRMAPAQAACWDFLSTTDRT